MKKALLIRMLAVCVALCTLLGCVALLGVSADETNGTDAGASDLDNDPGSLTYTVSEDGTTVTISYIVNGERVTYTVPNNNNYTSGGLVGTDDLGRSLYTTADEDIVSINSKEGERYVGLFYFLWQGEHGDSGIFDMQKILDEQGAAVAGSLSASGKWGPEGAMHWFAEPLYGYYYANDSWVHRKHAELLTNANIDFLYFDVTNGYTYTSNALSIMKELHELNEQGYDAPQVVFYTNTSAANVVRSLYDNIYKKGLYEDTWFCIDGKPVIIAPESANIDGFFTTKTNQWPNEATKTNSWPWMDFTWPQRVFKGTDGRDAISVSIAQHSGNIVFSSGALYGFAGNRGRSFNSKKATDKYLQKAWQAAQDDPTLSYQGLNFQAQWDRAIAKDVTFVLVTGWNEWVAQRQPGSLLGGADKVAFVDTFDIEYSRDAEMMRGGYFDNYYMQLAYNVQRYKGTAPVIVQDNRQAIDVSGSFSQWDSVLVTYHDPEGDTVDRNATGFGSTKYTNTTGRNDIVASKVVSDTKNIYFYVETADAITEADSSSTWMQLFLNVDGEQTGWYGYDYIVNYEANVAAGTTSVAKYAGTDNAFAFAPIGSVSYRVEGNKMMIAVPQSLLGIKDGHYDELCIQFKWVDSDSYISTMEEFYCDGDCAPLGRMNYVYQNYIPGGSSSSTPASGYEDIEDAGKMSADEYFENDESLVNGGAPDWLAENRASGISGVSSASFRGWVGIDGVEIDSFGYVVDGGEFVGGEFFEEWVGDNDKSAVQAAGGSYALRYKITVKAADLSEGEHTVQMAVKGKDGNVYILSAWGDLKITGTAVAGTEPVTEPTTEPVTDPGTDPATDPATDPVTDPVTEPVTDPETDPSTDEPSTEQPAETDAASVSSFGCFGTISGASLLALAGLCGGAVLVLKKRKDE